MSDVVTIIISVVTVSIAGAAAAHLFLSVFVLTCVMAGTKGYRRALSGCTEGFAEVPKEAAGAFVIPARNEAKTIRRAVESAARVCPDGFEILVVADNCTDATAAEARASGAIVVERRDDARIGKGYALAHAVRCLNRRPSVPDAILVIDADCIVECTQGPRAIQGCFDQCRRMRRPVQMGNLTVPVDGSSAFTRLSAFGFRVRGMLRSCGLARLGGGCQLGGTGMLLPLSIVTPDMLESGEAVEDLDLGLRLARLGHPPAFMTQVVVCSSVPERRRERISQQMRWECGHLAMITKHGACMLWRGLRSWKVLLMALDLCVPPLGLHFVMAMLLCALAAVASAIEAPLGTVAAMAAAGSMLACLCAVMIAYKVAGRDLLRVHELTVSASYMVQKASSLLVNGVVEHRSWRQTATRVGLARDSESSHAGTRACRTSRPSNVGVCASPQCVRPEGRRPVHESRRARSDGPSAKSDRAMSRVALTRSVKGAGY